jgi:hypothetical protein
MGVAITSTTTVPGSGTNASHPVDIALAASFYIEVASPDSVRGRLSFFDEEQHRVAVDRYGSMRRLQG